MRSRRARKDAVELNRLLRSTEAAQQGELDKAYSDAARAELFETNVAGDESLGRRVDALVESERLRSSADAWRVEQIDELRRTAELNVEVTTSHGMRSWSQAATARRVAVSEVAAALRIPERSAETLIEESRMLVEELPKTLDGLRAGDFSYRHAKSIVSHAQTLREELRAEFEAAVLPHAAKLTPSKFEEKARTTRERMDAATITERHLSAVEDRQIVWQPAPDGMGWLHIYDTAAKTRAAYDRADDLGFVAKGEDDPRTLMQRRTDVAMDLLLDGEVPAKGVVDIRSSVVLTIPALSLLGHPSAGGEIEPATLDGYGPIDIETAKQLMGNTKSWRRVLTHPISGVVVSVENRKRKIPAGVRAVLGLRDGRCRKVGCNRATRHCDLDHNEEWQNGGQNTLDNLEHLCPQHHDEKHHTPVRLRHLPNGDIEWTMASGRTYISEPEMRMDGFRAA